MSTLEDVTRDYGKVVAIAISTADFAFEIHDYILSWETAQQYAMDGYRIIVINDDRTMTKDELQRLCNSEFDRAIDCFGMEYTK